MNQDLIRAFAMFLKRRRAIVFTLSFLVGLAMLVTGTGQWLDKDLRGSRDQIRGRPASGEIRIVEIDRRSLTEIDSWPWPRSVNGRIIDKLREGEARAIAFDVEFSATSTPAEDASMAAALDRAGHGVILPTLRQFAGSGNSQYIDTTPAKPFLDKAFLASVNISQDNDGYVRRMLLGVETKGVPRPSLSALLAERNAEIDRSFLIDYSIDPETIPRISAVDLVSGRVPKSEIDGKRFIIGATAVEMGDRYTIPRHGTIPGVVIQALAAETLMAGPIPSEIGAVGPFLLAMIAIGLIIRFRSRQARFAGFTVAVASIMLLPLATESLWALSMPVGPAMFALTVAILLCCVAWALENYLESALADAATGLPNLAALVHAAGESGPRGVIVARIDRFAPIASGLGPEGTASLIRKVAERLALPGSEREIYRVDEASLAWLEPSVDEKALVEQFEAIGAMMRSPVDCGRPVGVSLSFGLADGAGLDSKQLVSNAVLASVHATQAGARHWRFVQADSDQVDWQLSLLGCLDMAMAQGQLWNAYQPKLDLASGAIVGVEALVRWAHPQRGAIGPDKFIPVIEEAGRIRDLTAFVLRQGLDDAVRWDESGFPIGVAVNVSATLLADHEFIETVGAILIGYRLPEGRVTIEVTETAAMDSPERAIAALESWRRHGVGISIDDYGTGQSSLGYLQKLPATELKIDQSFVRSIVGDARNAIMVRSTIAMAHELGLKVVAEGVEDNECLQALIRMGCDTAQGYHIARPMGAEAVTAFLGEQVKAAA